jgi:hypothetical protein
MIFWKFAFRSLKEKGPDIDRRNGDRGKGGFYGHGAATLAMLSGLLLEQVRCSTVCSQEVLSRAAALPHGGVVPAILKQFSHWID